MQELCTQGYFNRNNASLYAIADYEIRPNCGIVHCHTNNKLSQTSVHEQGKNAHE